MNRRSFITKLLAGSVAPMFLPGAGRIWLPADRELVYSVCTDCSYTLPARCMLAGEILDRQQNWQVYSVGVLRENNVEEEYSKAIGPTEQGAWEIMRDRIKAHAAKRNRRPVIQWSLALGHCHYVEDDNSDSSYERFTMKINRPIRNLEDFTPVVENPRYFTHV